MFKLIKTCIGKYKYAAIFSVILIIVEVLLEVAIPLQMTKLINYIEDGGRVISELVKMGLLMIGLALASLVVGACSGLLSAIASTGFSKNVRQKLFHDMQNFSFYNIDKFSTSSLVTRLTTDISNIQMTFMMIIRILVRSPVMLISVLVMAFNLNVRLALVFVILTPFMAMALAFIFIKAHPQFKKMLVRYDVLNNRVQENLIGIRAVKAFVREDYEIDNFKKVSDDLRRANFKAERIVVWQGPIMMITMYSCIIGILLLGGNLYTKGVINVGEISGMITYVTMILMSLMMISMAVVTMVISRVSVARVWEVMNEVPDINDDKADKNLLVENGEIVFDNVGFSYAKDKNNLVLENINLKINSGETIGIIGGTGSGKTSLVQLIPRLYDVTDGSLKIAGHDIKEYSIYNLREAISVVLQKNVLFSGTIKENLRWGNENATDEEMIEACKIAAADDFISSFPDGYDRRVEQGGVNFSGGQKQRLCIARALLKKPKILILDDSTSAVDTATDKKIREGFKSQIADTTKIIIAQRINSVMDADKIVVLNEGKIVAVGNHEELLSSCDIYKETYDLQIKDGDDNEQK